ncbi:hypothetical protein AAC387_Pa02g0327 [Persea americana]
MSSDTSTSTFNPDDKELLLDYLKRKIDNEDLPRDEIKEVELYKSGPKQLIAKFGGGNKYKNYFFTSTDRVRRNATNPKRSTKGGGYWRSRGSEEITDETNELIGTKRTLVFCKGKNKEGKSTNWIMDEYKLDKSQSVNCEIAPTDPKKLDQWVLCSVYKDKGFSERWNQQGKNQKSKEKEIVLQGPPGGNQDNKGLDKEREPTVPQGAITSSKGRQIDSRGTINGNQDNEQSVAPPFDNLPAEPTPKASDVGAKGDRTSVPHNVLSEELGTSSKEREIVLQQGPRNGNQDNKQSVAPPFDNLPAEPTPKASDVSAKGDHISVPLDGFSENLDTVLQQGPFSGSQANEQYVVDPVVYGPPAEPIPKDSNVGTKGDLMSANEAADLVTREDEEQNAK